jgi:hypothetical protein
MLESLATIQYHRPQLQKRGRIRSLPLFRWLKTSVRLLQLYLVFPSSFFSAGLSGIGAASLAGSLGAGAGAGSAGAAGAGGGGGGGAGSSFLPHPTNVSVKAKSIMADNETNFFPMLIHLLSRHF